MQCIYDSYASRDKHRVAEAEEAVAFAHRLLIGGKNVLAPRERAHHHDNPDDAAWIKNNLDEIARNLVLSVTEFFGLPFLTPIPARSGMVDVNWGSLNIRSRPSLDAPVLAQAPDGALLTIINQWQDWYLVNYNGTIGYAKDSFVTLN